MKIFESGSKKERAGKEKCPKKRKAPGGGKRTPESGDTKRKVSDNGDGPRKRLIVEP